MRCSHTATHSLIEGLSKAQDVVTDVASRLANIERPLAALEQLSILDEALSIATKEALKKTSVAEAVNKCSNAYTKFSKNLTKWTKHSSTTKLSLRDRLSVGCQPSSSPCSLFAQSGNPNYRPYGGAQLLRAPSLTFTITLSTSYAYAYSCTSHVYSLACF
jgi:hypothetical protein